MSEEYQNEQELERLEEILERVEEREGTGLTALRKMTGGIELIMSILGRRQPSQLFNWATILSQNYAKDITDELKAIAHETGDEEILELANNYMTMAKNTPAIFLAIGMLKKKGLESKLLPTENQIQAIRELGGKEYANLNNNQLLYDALFNISLDVIREHAPLQQSENLTTNLTKAYYKHFASNRFLKEVISQEAYNASMEDVKNGVDPRTVNQYELNQTPDSIQYAPRISM